MLNKKMKVGVVGIATTLLMLAGCASPSTPDSSSSAAAGDYSLVTDGTLTVAVFGSNPPYLTVEADGTLGGVDGQLISGFAKQEGLEVAAYTTTFASTILAVQQNRADMATYLFWTADRSKQLFYTLPFLGDTVVLFTNDDFAYDGPDSMKGHTIGAVQGVVWVPFLQEAIGTDNVRLYPDNATLGAALLSGQVDGIINGASAAVIPPLESASGYAAHELAVGDFGFPEDSIRTTSYNVVSCDNQGLATAYDEYVQGLADSGELDKLIATTVAEAVGDSGVVLPSLAPALTLPEQGC